MSLKRGTLSRLLLLQPGLEFGDEFRTRSRCPTCGGMQEHRHPVETCQLRRQLRWNRSNATRLQCFDVAFEHKILFKLFLVFPGHWCFFSEMLCFRRYRCLLAACSTRAARLSARNCTILTFASVSPSRVAVSRSERLRRKAKYFACGNSPASS